VATTFSTFDTTPAGAVAAIKAAILASTDWSNPAGDRVVCTTTRGASMVVDLADAAAIATRLQFGVYRTTGLADKIIRYLQWRGSGGATSDPLHCVVSAGKEHLYIAVEGPRAGEVNPETAAGSYKPILFLCDLVPYFASDTVPAVVCGGSTNAGIPISTTSLLVHVSRNAANTAPWVSGVLESLGGVVRSVMQTATYRFGGQPQSPAGQVVRPYIVFEDVAGMRGRLSSFYFLGWALMGTMGSDTPPQIFSRFTLGSASYIALTSGRSPSGTGVSGFGQPDSSDPSNGALVIAVPYS
jgi:hypothetical protein